MGSSGATGQRSRQRLCLGWLLGHACLLPESLAAAPTPPSHALYDQIDQIGTIARDTIIADRVSDWHGGPDVIFDSHETRIGSDGAYDGLGSGAWPIAVFAADGTLSTQAGRVDPGHGTNSSYRSETMGLFQGLHFVDVSNIKGRVVHVLDNQSVVKVYHDCETRGPKLVSSQDIWDEIIWLKRRLGPRYIVEWHRGHGERHGGFSSWHSKINHIADGLASLGYNAAVDNRIFFQHPRRWHVRLDGSRPFDELRSSTRLFLGSRHLRQYLDNKGDDRQLDLESLRAFSNGKSFRNMLTRAENTKFIHDQYASFTCLADWGYNIDSSCCRLCDSHPETLRHILISCPHHDCRQIRTSWYRKLMT